MTEDVIATIRELEERRYAAMLASDVDALDALCSERLVYIHSFGERDSKKSYLDKVKAGFFKYHEITPSTDDIIVLEGAVLVTGRMKATATVGDGIRHIDNACLAVWAREDGVWRFIAYQPTPLPRK